MAFSASGGEFEEGLPSSFEAPSGQRTIKLVVAYDGTAYQGWQRQKEAPTLQGTLEEAAERILAERVSVIGSGRTDAGVHALGQTCHFHTRGTLSPAVLKRALNSLLPPDIRVRDAVEAPPGFHARYSTRSKTYEFRIWNHEDPDLFLRRYTWHLPFPLDMGGLRASMPFLVGRHDFSSFRSAGSANRDPIRTILRAEVLGEAKALLRIVLEADGFLRHMVRNIVGTLVEVGRGKRTPEGFAQVMASRDRTQAGPKAPAHGLFLVGVSYVSS